MKNYEDRYKKKHELDNIGADTNGEGIIIFSYMKNRYSC